MMRVVYRCRERLTEELKQRMTVFTIDLNFTEDGKLRFITISGAHMLQDLENLIILAVFLKIAIPIFNTYCTANATDLPD